VTQGGFLYASVGADAAIPEMEQLFGARLADTVTASDVTLKIVAPFGDLKVGDTFHYSVPSGPRYWGALLEVKQGQVIAVDQGGRPALVANNVGAGKTLLSAYPLEVYLANVPSVFEKPEDTHRIYQAFRDWTGVKSLFRTDRSSVEVNALNGQHRGYAVLVNHSSQVQIVTVTTTLPVRSLNRITSTGSQPIQLDGSSWKMEIAPYDGAVVEWK
jgi:hypothetical protein